MCLPGRAESTLLECLPTPSGSLLSLRRSALVWLRLVDFAFTDVRRGVAYGSVAWRADVLAILWTLSSAREGN